MTTKTRLVNLALARASKAAAELRRLGLPEAEIQRVLADQQAIHEELSGSENS